jgi:hypothetical protein
MQKARRGLSMIALAGLVIMPATVAGSVGRSASFVGTGVDFLNNAPKWTE